MGVSQRVFIASRASKCMLEANGEFSENFKIFGFFGLFKPKMTFWCILMKWHFMNGQNSPIAHL